IIWVAQVDELRHGYANHEELSQLLFQRHLLQGLLRPLFPLVIEVNRRGALKVAGAESGGHREPAEAGPNPFFRSQLFLLPLWQHGATISEMARKVGGNVRAE